MPRAPARVNIRKHTATILTRGSGSALEACASSLFSRLHRAAPGPPELAPMAQPAAIRASMPPCSGRTRVWPLLDQAFATSAKASGTGAMTITSPSADSSGGNTPKVTASIGMRRVCVRAALGGQRAHVENHRQLPWSSRARSSPTDPRRCNCRGESPALPPLS